MTREIKELEDARQALGRAIAQAEKSYKRLHAWRYHDAKKNPPFEGQLFADHANSLNALRNDLQNVKDHLTALKAGDNGEALEHADRQICYHEETHRGGAIWTICDQCGAKFADDEGGVPVIESPYEQALSEMRERLK